VKVQYLVIEVCPEVVAVIVEPCRLKNPMIFFPLANGPEAHGEIMALLGGADTEGLVQLMVTLHAG
jgi:hypothetical protein